jgi:hypothetical protein
MVYMSADTCPSTELHSNISQKIVALILAHIDALEKEQLQKYKLWSSLWNTLHFLYPLELEFFLRY